MKVIATEQLVPRTVTKFLAIDGKEFDERDACQNYEQELLFSRLATIPHFEEANGYANFAGGECYESSDYDWYKPENVEQIKMLADAYGTICPSCKHAFSPEMVGTLICVEHRDDCVWVTTLNEGIEYASSLLEKFGYKLTLTKKEGGTK